MKPQKADPTSDRRFARVCRAYIVRTAQLAYKCGYQGGLTLYQRVAYTTPMQGRAQPMLKFAEKPVVVRAPLAARPQPQLDRKVLRNVISDRFSKTLEYLAR